MSKQVLIVEDDRPLRTFFRQVLSHADCEVTVTGSRVEAGREILEAEFDYLLIDIEVEDGNAMDLVAECCDANLNVIIITSNEEYFRECKALGVLAFVRKPLSGSGLIKLIHNINELDDPDVYVRA